MPLRRSAPVLSSIPAYGAPKTSRPEGAPAAGLSSEPANKQVKNMRPPLTSAVRDISGDGIPNADRANHKPSPCFAVAEILVQVDCSPQ